MRSLTIIAALICAFLLHGADPTETAYSFTECEGSMMPYPIPDENISLPDSLTAVFINHVGRHGSRFPASSRDVVKVINALATADSAKALTPAGEELLHLAKFVNETVNNRWGALDSLGMAEQRGIASRMFNNYKHLFNNTAISAMSSYSPRCLMSMYEFTHQLDRLNNHIEITTTSGRQNSPLLRPFDNDPDFQEWVKEGSWKEADNMQYETLMPTAPARKLFSGEYATSLSSESARELTFHIFKLLQGLPAMGLNQQIEKYFTRAEANQAWSCTNLSHYLEWTATTLSTAPAEIAAPLLVNLLSTAENAVNGENEYNVILRFGHAETLYPLLSLMRLDGCYYLTNYFDTVALHWKDFDITPMAANLQMIVAKTKKGKIYVRFDLNEKPIPLLPGSDNIYTPWQVAYDYLLRCIPLHLRP